MDQRSNRLNAGRAMELLAAAGNAGVPVRTWQDKGSWHAGRALLKSVSGEIATILPLQGHKKLEEVPVSSLSTWKGGMAAQSALHQKEQSMTTHAAAASDDSKFVVFDSERGLLFSDGIEGTKTRKGFTKKIEEAKLFDDSTNARRCAGHLANNLKWSEVLGEDFRLCVDTLAEYRKKRPHPFNEPPNANRAHVVQAAKAPQPVQSAVVTLPVTPEVKPTVIVHDSGVRTPTAEPKPIPAEPHPMVLQDMLKAPSAAGFSVSDAEFRELQSAYRDLEEAIALTQEAREKVMTALSRICGKMNVGLAAAGLTNSPS